MSLHFKRYTKLAFGFTLDELKSIVDSYVNYSPEDTPIPKQSLRMCYNVAKYVALKKYNCRL